jgi:hypothetical protein
VIPSRVPLAEPSKVVLDALRHRHSGVSEIMSGRVLSAYLQLGIVPELCPTAKNKKAIDGIK